MSGTVFIRIYESWKEETEQLTDEEKGRLIDALVDYAITRQEAKLTGNERFVYPGLVKRIRRETETHERNKERRQEERERNGR